MPRRKKSTAERIIGRLRAAEVDLARGKTVPGGVRKLGVTERARSAAPRPFRRQHPPVSGRDVHPRIGPVQGRGFAN